MVSGVASGQSAIFEQSLNVASEFQSIQVRAFGAFNKTRSSCLTKHCQ